MSKHSKRTARRLTFTTIILGLLSSLPLPAGNGRFSTFAKTGAPNHGTALSALQGSQAVQQLKAQGRYDSLQAAFDAARFSRPAQGIADAHALDPAMFEDTFSQEAKLMPSTTLSKLTFAL